MLSQEDILKFVKTGDIYLENFSKKDLRQASYNLHLDNKIAFSKKGKVDAQKLKNLNKLYDQKTVDEFVLKPGTFILGRTKEKVGISKKLGMLFDGKSTLARIGLTVTQTAMLIQPGHGVPKPRKIVMEIKNDSPFDITMKKGMSIAKCIFFKLETPAKQPYDLKGRYGIDPDALLPRTE